MASPARFDGAVEAGRADIVVDDNTGYGSTSAALRAHIESGGGAVAGVTARATGAGETVLAPTRKTRKTLKDRFDGEKFERLDRLLVDSFGFGVDGLTNAEARAVARAGSFDAVRDRIAAAGASADARRGARDHQKVRLAEVGDALEFPAHGRLLVSGGRDFCDRDAVFAVLDRLHARAPIGLLIHGDARWADRLAAEWAESRGVAVERYQANWDRHGYAAGSVRNLNMRERGRPDALIAFPGGRGTAHMVRIAREAGLPVATGGGLAYAIDETPPERRPWPRDFPKPIRPSSTCRMAEHPDYPAARMADDTAAASLLTDVLNRSELERLAALGGRFRAPGDAGPLRWRHPRAQSL